MIGTPLPLVFPTEFVNLLGSPGQGFERLNAQFAMMQQSGGLTDLLALQELHDDSLATAYTAAFSSTHDFLSSSSPSRGTLIFYAWRGTLLAIAVAVCGCVGTASLSALPSILFLAVLLVFVTFTPCALHCGSISTFQHCRWPRAFSSTQ